MNVLRRRDGLQLPADVRLVDGDVVVLFVAGEPIGTAESADYVLEGVTAGELEQLRHAGYCVALVSRRMEGR